MADKVTQTNELKFEWLFVDGDTRTFSIKNPKATITTAEITALETLIINAASAEDSASGVTLLIGDKASADFRRINTVIREEKITMVLDIKED